MLRRSHRKSKAGCLECKRRHIKVTSPIMHLFPRLTAAVLTRQCDETRPICRLCVTSEKICSYSSEVTREGTLRSDPYISMPATDIYNGDQPGPMLSPDVAKYLSTDELKHTTLDGIQIEETGDCINFHHMELIIHLTLNEEIFNLGDKISNYPHDLSFGLNMGLEFPYLLYQMLAFSAHHLAYLRPERSVTYQNQAVALQTRAVSLFNTSEMEIDKSNCVPVMLFSTILGHHILADVLSKRDPRNKASFIDQLTQCLKIQRGIYTIFHSALPILMESELRPILSSSLKFTSRQPQGNHCGRLKQLLDCADGLNEEEKEACRLATRYLQIGFDAILSEEDEEDVNRYHMIYSWTMLVPPTYTDLLTAKRPEALGILGYYSLLLHYGRGLWQVKDAGKYMMHAIVETLDLAWLRWIEYPRTRIE
ncbi:putative C6 finger domain protein [Corynespora cassiicola Philippines]|uniref:Putative C6 finger domain protein n=1 Tax=Corynespora cassiicola Philippines TaxID=1448308 RepID=A0A2T2N2V3_CORCC|nr:putative C6 finger domain protein [Corynespora cassiicola Philippines]